MELGFAKIYSTRKNKFIINTVNKLKKLAPVMAMVGMLNCETKERLKDLETQISQYEFDIEQEKQRNYVYLTPAKIKQFLESAMKGDTNLVSVRKTIVRFLIREIIMDNERLIITYNFTDNNLPKKAIPDNIDEVSETAKAVVDNSSNDLDHMPPKVT